MLLKFENIRYVRERNVILDDVNLEIKKGENWALLGLNGSGKSTLLSLVQAYNTFTSGKMYVFGKEFGKFLWEDIKKDVGFSSSVLDSYRTFMNMTLREVVISGYYSTIGLYREVSQEAYDRADYLIDLFGLEYRRDFTFSKLSTGERRRTMLARSFAAIPKLLLLDEPCSGLDLYSTEHLLQSLKTILREQDTNIVYVTHSPEEIIEEISHVALLDDGKIYASGLKEDVLTSENLSEVFHCDLSLKWINKRPRVTVNSL